MVFIPFLSVCLIFDIILINYLSAKNLIEKYGVYVQTENKNKATTECCHHKMVLGCWYRAGDGAVRLFMNFK
jgi:hypothetical protein